MNAIPTLGYPSKSAAILGLRLRGATEREIATRLGIKTNTVSSMEARARARLRQTVSLPDNIWLDLQRAAWRRGMRTDALAEKLLRTAVAGGLVDTLLEGLMP